VAVRTSGSFNIQTQNETVQGISHRHCRCIYRADGYTYYRRTPNQHPSFHSSHAKGMGFLERFPMMAGSLGAEAQELQDPASGETGNDTTQGWSLT